MKVTQESPVGSDMLKQFDAVADEGRALLGDGTVNTAGDLIAAIDDYVSREAASYADDVDVWEERALPVGTLWGETLVRELGWEWVKVQFEDESGAIGVFSRDRSVGIYPWYFIYGCIENGAPVTIELAWNMVREGAIPAQPANSHTNLMDGVHHIIPPR